MSDVDVYSSELIPIGGEAHGGTVYFFFDGKLLSRSAVMVVNHKKEHTGIYRERWEFNPPKIAGSFIFIPRITGETFIGFVNEKLKADAVKAIGGPLIEDFVHCPEDFFSLQNSLLTKEEFAASLQLMGYTVQ